MRVKVPTTVHVSRQRASSPSSRGALSSLDELTAGSVGELTERLAEFVRQGVPVALACDNTLEGVLGAVGVTYLAHALPERVRLVARDSCQQRLGEELLDVLPDSTDELVSLARRVYRGFRQHITSGCTLMSAGRCPASCGAGCTRKLVFAAASCAPSAPEALHRFLRLAFDQGPHARKLVSDKRVVAVDELARLTLGECEHTRQFLRFSRLADGSYAAVFRPRADTVNLTARHFARRMGTERFCIVDPVHLVAALHEPAHGTGGCAVFRLDRATADALSARGELAYDERYVRAMWRRLYDGLALPGRDRTQRGYDLRTGWMPRRFWEGLTELDPSSLDPGPLTPLRYASPTSPPTHDALRRSAAGATSQAQVFP